MLQQQWDTWWIWPFMEAAWARMRHLMHLPPLPHCRQYSSISGVSTELGHNSRLLSNSELQKPLQSIRLDIEVEIYFLSRGKGIVGRRD